MPSHNANFCPDCFIVFFETAVQRGLNKFPISKSTPLMVAVSGGKDSLAIWNVLHELGYNTRGLHIRLGIDGFSEASSEAVAAFAQERSLPWVEYSLEDLLGFSIPTMQRRVRRKICSICGMLKRRLLNRLAIQEGCNTVVVGHNLDDEAGRLLGNIVRNRRQYLGKQTPYLPSTHPKLTAKCKPLYRVEAREIRTYCRLKSIRPVELACPLSRGATSHRFKEALELLEESMPGTKRDFLFSYLRGQATVPPSTPFQDCRLCGEPSYGEICGVCRLLELLQKMDQPHPGFGTP